MNKKLWAGSTILLLGLVGYGLYYGWQALPIATAYSAKIMCSCIFVSDRPEEDIRNEELSSFDFVDFHINHLEKSVEADVMRTAGRKAVFRPGLGCTLVGDQDSLSLVTINKTPPEHANQRWPTGNFGAEANSSERYESDKLDNALDRAFDEPDPDHLQGTRAVLVINQGKIVAERYADGFTKNTPLLGWSMTKSVTNALLGILVQNNLLSLDEDHLFQEWSDEDDPRSKITLDNLLRMSSGLRWDERYSGLSDATRMLFAQSDAAQMAFEKTLEFSPGEYWEYSSGTSNILSKLVKQKVGGTVNQYFNFPHDLLFNKIGMRSAIIEPDASNTFVGSSFMYATARDWARFALLYLNDGEWEGERILPEGWVDYSRSLTTASAGRYAAHFWLTAGELKGGAGLPEDAYHLAGYEGQKVVIIPSYDLVIVRLGFSNPESNWDFTGFVRDILGAFPNPK
ncbi:MAG: serine hydrolase domain-containing protein [Cyclobacteriaceae bacterium]